MNETGRRKSQSTNILLALQSGRKLTCLNMLQDFHCGNGKGRIHELRKTHPEIEDEWITTEGGARVKRWFIRPDREPLQIYGTAEQLSQWRQLELIS